MWARARYARSEVAVKMHCKSGKSDPRAKQRHVACVSRSLCALPDSRTFAINETRDCLLESERHVNVVVH